MIAYLLAPFLAFITSVVFFLPFDVILLVLSGLDKVPVNVWGHHIELAKYGTDFPWLLPVVAALGSNLGTTMYYFMGAGAIKTSARLKRKMESFDMERFRNARDVALIVSSITSIPPIAPTAVAAGIIRMNYARYFYMTYIGKTIRFYIVILIGRSAIEIVTRLFS